MRLNSVACTTDPFQLKTATLTWDGLASYTGSFSYGGDTFSVTLTRITLTSWTMTIANTAGCGFASCTYGASAASYLGPWPDVDAACTGVCGCVDAHIYYQNVSVS